MHYILQLMDPDRDIPGLSDRKKIKNKIFLVGSCGRKEKSGFPNFFSKKGSDQIPAGRVLLIIDYRLL